MPVYFWGNIFCRSKQLLILLFNFLMVLKTGGDCLISHCDFSHNPSLRKTEDSYCSEWVILPSFPCETPGLLFAPIEDHFILNTDEISRDRAIFLIKKLLKAENIFLDPAVIDKVQNPGFWFESIDVKITNTTPSWEQFILLHNALNCNSEVQMSFKWVPIYGEFPVPKRPFSAKVHEPYSVIITSATPLSEFLKLVFHWTYETAINNFSFESYLEKEFQGYLGKEFDQEGLGGALGFALDNSNIELPSGKNFVGIEYNNPVCDNRFSLEKMKENPNEWISEIWNFYFFNPHHLSGKVSTFPELGVILVEFSERVFLPSYFPPSTRFLPEFFSK